MTRDELFSELRDSLSEMFHIEPEVVAESAHLRDDLDWNSIDAIDLAVHPKSFSGAASNFPSCVSYVRWTT